MRIKCHPKRNVAAQAKLATDKNPGIKLSRTYQEPSEMQTKGVHYLEFDLLDFDPFHEMVLQPTSCAYLK